MLILSRKQGQEIIIGDNISIKVLKIQKKFDKEYVELAINAPSNVKVLRKELIDKPKDSDDNWNR